MTIKELQTKYKLLASDFWEIKINKNGKIIGTGTWVIKHDACEKIATKEKIKFGIPKIINSDYEGILCLIEQAWKQDNKSDIIWTTGEASPQNVRGQGKYYWAMAEKRLKDRLTLKMINAYEFGIYSEDEAEEFEEGKTPEVQIKKDFKFPSQAVVKFNAVLKAINGLSGKAKHIAIQQAIETGNFTADECATLTKLIPTKDGKTTN